jgi:Tfp pilus assembly protein PilF
MLRMTLSPAIMAELARGQEALEARDYIGAQRTFRRVWQRLPADPAVAQLVANAHRMTGEVATAREVLRTAWARGGWEAPPVAHALGTALLEVGAPAEAVRCFAHVVAQRPADPAGTGALAAATRAAGDPAGAWPLIQRALRLAPRTPAFLLTAAQIRHSLGDLAGAQRWLDQCERERPGHGPTRVQRAYTTLLGGSNAAGWAAYEARPLPHPGTGARGWAGEPLNGGSVLVMAEQGVGDLFQFLRFVPGLAAQGAGTVLVEAPAGTAELLAASGLTPVPRGAHPPTDWYVPLLSLPHLLATDQAVWGERVPYLRPPATAAPLPLPASPPEGRRLGVVWAGNPAFPGGVLRHLDPAQLPRLLTVAGVEWVALQQGDDALDAPPAFTTLPTPGSWGDTARWLASMDGLVTVDTGIAHLAGAMGVRTWVLLAHDPDWRWGLGNDRTPWYPTQQLVRQPAPRDWDGAMSQLLAALHAWRESEGMDGADRGVPGGS